MKQIKLFFKTVVAIFAMTVMFATNAGATQHVLHMQNIYNTTQHLCVDYPNDTIIIYTIPYCYPYVTLWKINGVNAGIGDSLMYVPMGAGTIGVTSDCGTPISTTLMFFTAIPSHANFTVTSGGHINTTKDTVWMCGPSVTMASNTIGSECTSYTWYGPGGYTNSSDDPIVISLPGMWIFERPNPCGVTRDTFHVISLPATLPVFSDTTFCNVPVTLLLDPGPGWDYYWYSDYIQRNMNNGATAVASNTIVGFFDSGGINGNYDTEEDYTHTFVSETGGPLTIVFYSMDIATGDYIYIYDGPNTGSPLLLNAYSGSSAPASITTTGASMTIRFINPLSPITWGAGWSAIVYNEYYKKESQPQTIFIDSAGTYSVCLANACNIGMSTIHVIEQNYPVPDLGSDVTMCYGQSLVLDPSPGYPYPSYLWSDGSAGSTLTVTETGSFTVTVSQGACSEVSNTANITVTYPYEGQEICIVSVDTNTWKNRIIWNKNLDFSTAGFSIFKEVATNIYSGIGYVAYSSSPVFIDVNSQPEAFANRYKIVTIDTCGNESSKSFYHMTMNLTIAANGNTMGLNWSHYIDESGLFVPSVYNIYRGVTPNNMQLLATVPGTVTSYNDVNVFDVYYYMIGVERTGGCDYLGNNTRSYSNKKDNSYWVSANNMQHGTGSMIIYPNPMTTSATLTIPNLKSEIRNPKSETGSSSDLVLRISDLTGKLVRTIPLARHPELVSGSTPAQITLERSDLKPGIYFIELKADRVYRGKLVVE